MMAILVARRRLRLFGARTHVLFVTLGLFLFSTNYVLFYLATRLGMTTGLMAVIFSFLISMNMINSRVFFGERPKPQVVVGALIGLVGHRRPVRRGFRRISADDIARRRPPALRRRNLYRLARQFCGAQAAADASRRAERHAWGMSYGAAFLLVAALALTLSSIFENYHWTALKLCGVGLILLGNLAVMGKLSVRRRRSRTVPQVCP